MNVFYSSDYGYVRQYNGVCKKDTSIQPMKICKDGEEVEKTFSTGQDFQYWNNLLILVQLPLEPH